MNYHRQNGCFPFTEDPFDRNAQSISKICHEISLLLRFLLK